MHIPRLYTPDRLAEGITLRIDGQAAHHVANVLRQKVGATIQVFDGKGHEHRSRIEGISRSTVTLHIAEAINAQADSSLQITLLQGIARNEHMDMILQKAVELGVSTLQPIWMQRSQTHLKGVRLEKRVRHWKSVIISACEQCGRATLPALSPVKNYATGLDEKSLSGACIMLQPKSKTTLPQLTVSGNHFVVLVGPEGGLTEAEQTLAVNAGFQGVQLGPRILRTETAALAAITSIQTLWGDFN